VEKPNAEAQSIETRTDSSLRSLRHCVSALSIYPQIIAAARIYLNMPRRPETAPAPHRSLDAAAI